jgi:L-ascorbate metabolism protein UlaG (beta-lactamase superfamily)
MSGRNGRREEEVAMAWRITCLLFLAFLPAKAWGAECLAMAEGEARVQQAALKPTEVSLTYVGHSTFIIESPGGTRIATDYSGYAGGIIPDAVTMNRAHSTHYTDFPDPAIRHVLRGWNPDGGPAQHDLSIGDIRVRNVTTDIRAGTIGRVPDGNSISIFEIAGLCIGHLGHLHHELAAGHVGMIGRLDVVLVPVDGGYTMAQVNMMQVLKDLKARLVIPMHYFGPETLARFLAKANADFTVQHSAEPRVVVALETLPEKTTVLVLPGR